MTERPAPRVVTFAQRIRLVEVLEREADRLYKQAEELDRSMSERWPSDVVIEEDDVEYDKAATEYDAADTLATSVDELRALFDAARIVTLRPEEEHDPVATVTRAFVAAWSAGVDVGEVVALAASEAQRIVFSATEEYLTSNRPGSWEANYLEQIIESSGWEHEL